jgi:IAA-amino acid hydrolase
MEENDPLHSPYFVIDVDVLPVGAPFHAAVAMEYLIEHTTPGPQTELRTEL